MATISKVVNFRVPYDVYEEFLNDSKTKNVSLTDCILGRLNEANKVDSLNKRIIELEKQTSVYMQIMVDMLLSHAETDEERKEAADLLIAELTKLYT